MKIIRKSIDLLKFGSNNFTDLLKWVSDISVFQTVHILHNIIYNTYIIVNERENILVIADDRNLFLLDHYFITSALFISCNYAQSCLLLKTLKKLQINYRLDKMPKTIVYMLQGNFNFRVSILTLGQD